MNDLVRDHEWRSRDGLKLLARVYGAPSDALPVICIPGLTRNSRDFEVVAPYIAEQGRQVFAVDLRGRGRSDRSQNPKTYTPVQYAADMVALLASIEASRALFVGTSLGGLVTMTLAMRQPGLIGGAVLNDVGPRVGKAGLARIRGYAGKPFNVTTWEDATAYVKRTNEAAFPDLDDSDWHRFARRLFKEENGKVVLDYDPGIARSASPLAAFLSSMMLWPAFRRLARCGPLTLVYGETSDILERETVQRMERQAPAMTVVEVPGVGHAPQLNEPEAQRAIKTFLQTAP